MQTELHAQRTYRRDALRVFAANLLQIDEAVEWSRTQLLTEEEPVLAAIEADVAEVRRLAADEPGQRGVVAAVLGNYAGELGLPVDHYAGGRFGLAISEGAAEDVWRVIQPWLFGLEKSREALASAAAEREKARAAYRGVWAPGAYAAGFAGLIGWVRGPWLVSGTGSGHVLAGGLFAGLAVYAGVGLYKAGRLAWQSLVLKWRRWRARLLRESLLGIAQALAVLSLAKMVAGKLVRLSDPMLDDLENGLGTSMRANYPALFAQAPSAPDAGGGLLS